MVKSPPKKIKNGVILLIIALILGILRSIIGIPMLEQQAEVLVATIMVVFFTLLIAFLICMIYKGKNWARITFLVIYIFGFTLNIGNVIAWINIPILLIIYAIEVIITLIALVFIFQDKSSKWFNKNL